MGLFLVFGFCFVLLDFTTNEERNIEEAGRQDAGYPSLSPLIRKPVATCAEVRVRVGVRVSESLFCCWVCFWFFVMFCFVLLDFTTTERNIFKG